MDELTLRNFLIEAKANTYASGRAEKTYNQDGSKQFRFSKGVMSYRDRYLGKNPVLGVESVKIGDILIWSMNYIGHTFVDDLPTGAILGFLRQALQKPILELPFRGPESFSEGEWNYKHNIQGDLEIFHGEEWIKHQGELVYRLAYSGTTNVDI
jgi:hypothetical protein